MHSFKHFCLLSFVTCHLHSISFHSIDRITTFARNFNEILNIPHSVKCARFTISVTEWDDTKKEMLLPYKVLKVHKTPTQNNFYFHSCATEMKSALICTYRISMEAANKWTEFSLSLLLPVILSPVPEWRATHQKPKPKQKKIAFY